MKRIASLAALAVLMAGSCPGQSPAAPADKPPLRVLSIGNSFSASLCRYLPAMAAASGEKLEFCNLFIGGCSLKRHAGNAARAGADPAFAPYDVTWFRADDPAHPAKFRSNIPQMLATQKWDVVTLQQASHESWKPESFHPWADSLVATVRSLAPDAEIVWHETWSYNAADARIGGKFPDWPFDQAGMYTRVETNALALARDFGLRVIPVGLAVQKRRAALAAAGPVFDPAALSPGDPIDLRGEPVGALGWKDGRISGDTIHLNRSGEYLQAATWLGFLFGRDVRELSFAPADAGDDETRAALRAAAQDALDEAKARGWQDFAPKKAGPPVWRAKRTTGDAMDHLLPDPKTAVFVSVTNGVVDAGTTSPLDDKDLCYWFDCFYSDDALYVSVVVFDDDRQSDSSPEGSVSCTAWDDDAVEIFLDGEFARLPDSRANGGVHLKHGGEFTLVANGAAMSDFSGYPKTFVPLMDLDRQKAVQASTNVWWTGMVLPVLSGPGETVPGALSYNFLIPWAAMGRTNAPARIGFNVGVQDDDGGGRRNHALYWTGNPQRPFSDESAFGVLVLE